MEFELHDKLKKDCYVLGHFPLSLLLMMDDANYPWFILVPQRANVTEIYQLSEQDQLQLMRESTQLARGLAQVFAAQKLNVAALGNMVPQLHIHHIVRYQNDPAWPHPVWGWVEGRPYERNQVDAIRSKMAQELGEGFKDVGAGVHPESSRQS